jgi:tetratricopeptide (TPR) repeat protein
MNQINYEMIGRYLEGELSGEELLAFETAIKNDPALAEEVRLYQRINEEMKSHAQGLKEEQSLKQTLNKLNAEHFGIEDNKVRKMNRWWFAAAAAVAAAIVLFILRPFSGTSFKNEKVFAAYMKEVEPLPGVVRGNEKDTLLEKATDLYNRKQYKEALPLLREISTAKPGDAQVKLAAGICLLQTGQYDAADAIFNEIAGGDTIYQEEAVWYKALTALITNKREECYSLLQSLPAGSSKAEKAKELMKKIESQRKNK